MKKNLWDDKKLDTEEMEIEQAFENGEMQPIPNEKEEIEKIKAAVHYTLQKNKVVNLRLAPGTLYRLKIQAMEEGLPYQTYMASVLHKHAMKPKTQ